MDAYGKYATAGPSGSQGKGGLHQILKQWNLFYTIYSMYIIILVTFRFVVVALFPFDAFVLSPNYTLMYEVRSLDYLASRHSNWRPGFASSKWTMPGEILLLTVQSGFFVSYISRFLQ